MSIWTTHATPEQINEKMKGSMGEHIGIDIIEVGDNYIKATMPVDERTKQHMGIIHGGASCALAETLGSIAANMCTNSDSYCVGLEINANHIRAGKPPLLTGITKPLHIGNSTMVWEIKITDTENKLVCISRLTVAVLKNDKN